MGLSQSALVATFLSILHIGAFSLAGTSGEMDDELETELRDQSVLVGADYLLRGSDQVPSGGVNPDKEYRWSVECEDGAVGCHPAPEPCEEGFAWNPARDRRTRVPGGEWTEWVKVSRGGCAPVTVPSIDAETVAREFRELPLPKLSPKTQPVGYAVVNLPTILYVTPQRFSEHVLIAGHSVIVEAWPVQYTWDPGDGAAPIVTDHPGEVYPNQTITHTYTECQQVTLTLTTTWAGRFQTSTSGWVDIPGNAITTSQLPLDVKVVRAYLVGEAEAG